MTKRIICFLFLFCILFYTLGDSLWDPGFEGYLTGNSRLQVGDTVLVKIQANTTLAIDSVSKENKNLTLEFSGGEMGDLFSFLPQVTSSGNSRVQTEESYSLDSRLPVRVVNFDEGGNAFVSGSRSLEIDGKEEKITLSGYLALRDLGPDRMVDFSLLVDAQLKYQSFLSPGTETLTPEDIIKIVTETLETSASGEELPAGEIPGVENPAPEGEIAGGAPGETILPAGEEAGNGTLPPGKENLTSGYTIPEEKKKELVLIYLNRLVDIIFQ